MIGGLLNKVKRSLIIHVVFLSLHQTNFCKSSVEYIVKHKKKFKVKTIFLDTVLIELLKCNSCTIKRAQM